MVLQGRDNCGGTGWQRWWCKFDNGGGANGNDEFTTDVS